MSKKVFLFGIDGAPPEYVFDKYIDFLPNFKKLMDKGKYGRVITSIPPSTCVAWNSLLSGKDASQLGIFSYTMRENFSYKSNRIIDSRDIRTEMIWDTLSKNGKKTIAISVPVTYPITKEKENCELVSGFLSPEFNEKSVSPKEFYNEVKELIPDYMFDVNVGLASYKKEGKDQLIEKIYKMTRQNIQLTKHCIKNKEWDFLACILIGSDRMEHSFWSYIDDTHRYYKGDTQYKDVLKDYFIYLDKELGKIMKMLPEDTTIIVSSDHGMGKMNCRFNVNDWLRKEGYLVLKEEPKEPKKLDMSDVDWTKTKAFSVGAYFGRIYLNMKNREPEGIVEKEESENLIKEIADKLKNIPDDKGNPMDNRIYFPKDIYSGEFINEAPDLMIYFDYLSCGVNNDVGNTGLYTWETTKGSDDAGHMPEGTFIISSNNIENPGNLGKFNIVDVTPTILSEMEVEIPGEIKGKKLI